MTLRRPLCVCIVASACGAAAAQQMPPAAPVEIPMEDYLGLLERIAPAARMGAEAYLRSFELRCGRTLSAAQLRRAIAHGTGDPVLMGMIRASQLRDADALADLGRRVACEVAP